MEAQEKQAKDILRRELGHFYKGQSIEELGKFNFLCGFYVKTCHEEKIELKSEVLMELQIRDTCLTVHFLLNCTFFTIVQLSKKCTAKQVSEAHKCTVKQEMYS